MSTPPADQTRDDDLRARLTPLQYEVTQRQATERAFTGEYWDCHDDGTYHCVVCDEPLFSSDTKYESGSGWPSFFEPVHEGAIETRRDTSHGMVRDEIVCATCGAHVGHVFPDGPKPTGERYCTNSASLRLANDTEADGASADG
jgi:peptide-methionine (R)-S-oxide reductase